MKKKHRNWQQLDNVANLFLASYNNRDPRVMRLCCTLKEAIRPKVLQEALNATVAIRPQFQVKIHRGIFWRYIEESSDMPLVEREEGRVCPQLFYPDRPEKPLYKVTYYKNRINLDIFHAISDGTGAIEFLNILILEYLRRMHRGAISDLVLHEEKTPEQLAENSFKSNFNKDRRAALKPEKAVKAYHPSGRKLTFDQLQFFEVHMPSKAVVSRAKALNISVSSYIGAALIMAFIACMPNPEKRETVTISMPVNLRNYYDSGSIRNFFNSINISHKSNGREDIRTLGEKYQRHLKWELLPRNMKYHMNYYQSFQSRWGIRPVPLFFKEFVLDMAARRNEKCVSAVLSNLGAVRLPKEVAAYIDYYSAYCSAENPFVTICSFEDKTTMGIAYPYKDLKLMKSFMKILTNEGIPIKLYATEVVR